MRQRCSVGICSALVTLGLTAALAGCGPKAPSATSTATGVPVSPPSESPSATFTPQPSAQTASCPSGSSPLTPTASAAPPSSPSTGSSAPLIVTVRYVGPAVDPSSAVVLTLVTENGTVAGSVDNPGGIDGDAYALGANHVYFIDGTSVKALGRDGEVTTVGEVPQPPATVTASSRETLTALTISPDESTFMFGIPLQVAGDNGARGDHSQLWTEPVGCSAASAAEVYDYVGGSTDDTLMPFAWTAGRVWVSALNTTGLGGAGPFIDYSAFNPMLFEPSSHTMSSLPSSCILQSAGAVNAAGSYVCQGATNPAALEVVTSSATTSVTASTPDATQFGAYRVSDDGRFLAYGTYVGEFGNGHYVTTILELSTGATVATLQGYTPSTWLQDDRLIVSPAYHGGAPYLLSSTFTGPTRLSADQPVGALP